MTLDLLCHANILLTYLVTKIQHYIRQPNLAGPFIAGYEKMAGFQTGLGSWPGPDTVSGATLHKIYYKQFNVQ